MNNQFIVLCPRNWRAQLNDFDAYLPQNIFNGLVINVVEGINSHTKKNVCIWRVKFTYICNSYKTVYLNVDINKPRNTKIKLEFTNNNYEWIVQYIVSCRCKPLDFSKPDDIGNTVDNTKEYKADGATLIKLPKTNKVR